MHSEIAHEHDHRHVYAIHVGRLPGVYTSWVDCYAQISSWTGGCARAHTSIAQAKEELENDTQVRQILCYPRIVFNCEANDSGSSFPPCLNEEPYDNYLIEYNTCAWLTEVADTFNITGPSYEMVDTVENNNTLHYRYKARIVNPREGRTMASVGKFATTLELAKQHAAVGILRRLQPLLGKVIIDFNYHNIKLLESHISMLNDRMTHLKNAQNLTANLINEVFVFNNTEGHCQPLFVDEMMYTDILLRFSMQHWLEGFAGGRRLEQPRYTLQKRITHNGRRFYRYYVAVNFHVLGRPPVSMGRFASTEHLAREDAALSMLRRLQSSMSRSIIDFNFYKVNAMEVQISNILCEMSKYIHERLSC